MSWLPSSGPHGGWGFDESAQRWAHILTAPFVDPTAAVSGFIAGVAARSLVAATDARHVTAPPQQRRVQILADKRSMGARVTRRGVLYGLLLGLYVPAHRIAQYENPDGAVTKERMRLTVLVTFYTVLASRVALTVWSNVADSAKENRMSSRHALKFLTRHETLPGLTTLFVGQPPLLTALAYHGLTLLSFEAMRRFYMGSQSPAEELARRREPLFALRMAAINGAIAATCAVSVSALTLFLHRPYYKSELMRPTALSFPAAMVWRREAVLVGGTFFAFSLLQPLLSPHHARAGFGY
jgi:hypothetical protein